MFTINNNCRRYKSMTDKEIREEMEDILKQINLLTKRVNALQASIGGDVTDNSDEKSVDRIMDECGAYSKVKGYVYFRRAVCLILEKPQMLMKEAYMIIGEEYEEEPKNVERAIRYFLKKILKDAGAKPNSEIQRIYKKYFSNTKRVGNSRIIAVTAEYLRTNS